MSKLHKVNSYFLLVTVIILMMNAYRVISYERLNRFSYSFSQERIDYRSSDKILIDIPTSSDSEIISRKGGYEVLFMDLPDSLKVSFLSILEKKAYQGAFKLPAIVIDSLYKHDNYYKGRDGDKHGYMFNFSFEPQGVVDIWINKNSYHKKRIARFKATEISEWNRSPIEDIDNYILKHQLYEAEEIDSLVKNNIPFDIDPWNRYKKESTYYILVHPESDVRDISINFLNGEKDRFNFTLNKKILVKSGKPSNLVCRTENSRYFDRLSFDDEELIRSFDNYLAKLSPLDTMVVHIKGSVLDESLEMRYSSTERIKAFKIYYPSKFKD